MARIKRFEDIEGWKKGRELRKAIYKHSQHGEFAGDFSPKDQIRRAAQSVTSNIAEGFERGGNREFIQFLSDAKGSCGEVRDQLYTALDENYVTQAEFDRLYAMATETSRLIAGFIKYLQQSELRGTKFRTRGPAP
ncbi:MAG: four helix bundle protein [Verrucomicrobia bacterium]|nr:MAG: four helix bundle protein [Verrucomicrobiota bacterium]PYJ97209.1 MAG: four helix bundle protein [Verrucomicrobiota bacterium]